MKPLVSIIVPIFNAREYIRVAIESILVLESSDYDIEILAVDDASTDATLSILEEFQDHPAVVRGRIRYRLFPFSNNTPGGVCCSANFGLDKAEGDYIAFVDADDWLVPHEFLRAVAALDHSSHDFVLNRNWDYHAPTSERRPHGDVEKMERLSSSTLTQQQLKSELLRVSAVPWRKIYRREFIERNRLRFKEVNYPYEDNPFHWECVLAATSIGLTDYHTHVYRIAHGSQSISGGGTKFLNMLRHYDPIAEALQRHGESGTFEPQLISWLIDHILWVGDLLPRHAQPLLFERASDLLQRHSFELIIAELEKFTASKWVVDRILSIYYRDMRWFMSLK